MRAAVYALGGARPNETYWGLDVGGPESVPRIPGSDSASEHVRTEPASTGMSATNCGICRREQVVAAASGCGVLGAELMLHRQTSGPFSQNEDDDFDGSRFSISHPFGQTGSTIWCVGLPTQQSILQLVANSELNTLPGMAPSKSASIETIQSQVFCLRINLL